MWVRLEYWVIRAYLKVGPLWLGSFEVGLVRNWLVERWDARYLVEALKLF